jgi:hypothetical protein
MVHIDFINTKPVDASFLIGRLNTDVVGIINQHLERMRKNDRLVLFRKHRAQYTSQMKEYADRCRKYILDEDFGWSPPRDIIEYVHMIHYTNVCPHISPDRIISTSYYAKKNNNHICSESQDGMIWTYPVKILRYDNKLFDIDSISCVCTHESLNFTRNSVLSSYRNIMYTELFFS